MLVVVALVPSKDILFIAAWSISWYDIPRYGLHQLR
jgi:hypothetical protein